MDKFLYVACGVIFLLSVATAQAEIYQYHPNSRLYMGGGYNPFKPNQGYLRCIDYDGTDQVDTAGSGAVRTDAKIMMVRSRKEFYNAIEFSAAISASYLFVSGGASVQLENESAFQSDSVSWLILFRSDYGRTAMRNPRIQPGLDTFTEEDLYGRCGSEIVTEERNGAMAYALFTVSNLTESQKSKLNTQFNVNFRGGIFNASAEASFKSFMSNVAAVSHVSITVNAIGGQGITALVSLLDDSNNQDIFAKYNSVPLILAKYIRGMDVTHAVPTQYVTTQLKSFIPSLGNRFADFKTKQVTEMFNWHQDLSSSLTRLRNILHGTSSDEYQLTNEESNALQININEHAKAMNEIYGAAQNCFEPQQRTDCQLPANALSLKPIRWPKRKEDNGKCQALREFALSSKLATDDEEYRLATEKNFAPYIIFSSDMKASIEGWHRCEDLFSGNVV